MYMKLNRCVWLMGVVFVPQNNFTILAAILRLFGTGESLPSSLEDHHETLLSSALMVPARWIIV